MNIIEVPVFNQDGSVQFTAMLTPDQAKILLQFAYNFLIAAGLTAKIAAFNQEQIENINPGLND